MRPQVCSGSVGRIEANLDMEHLTFERLGMRVLPGEQLCRCDRITNKFWVGLSSANLAFKVTCFPWRIV